MTRYTVTAERGQSGVWVFQCVEHPGAISQARRLSDVEHLMREAIAFVADVDESDVEIVLESNVDKLVRDLMGDARRKREEAERLSAEAAEDMVKAARFLIETAHLPLRDAGYLMGVSHQRVAQLLEV